MIEITLAVVIIVCGASAGFAIFKKFRRKDRVVLVLDRLTESRKNHAGPDSVSPRFQRALVHALKTNPNEFDFHSVKKESDVTDDIAGKVAEEVYGDYFSLSTLDGIVSQQERRTLDALADLLLLAPPQAEMIEQECMAAFKCADPKTT
jgi:hypothetical protein